MAAVRRNASEEFGRLFELERHSFEPGVSVLYRLGMEARTNLSPEGCEG